MPTYGYDCARCGAFDLIRPMARAGDTALCPGCGAPARRLFGAPALRSVDPALRRALDASAASADAPPVVDRVPGRSRRATRVTTDPRHLRLPRP
jgi:putative FmdB family regulatory protein